MNFLKGKGKVKRKGGGGVWALLRSSYAQRGKGGDSLQCSRNHYINTEGKKEGGKGEKTGNLVYRVYRVE